MYFKDIGYLMKENTTFDTKNRPKVSYDEIMFFCNKKSIRQSEFYQSQAAGYKPEIMLETKFVDLHEVNHVKYDGVIYKIQRKYQKEDLIELVLSSTVVENK